MKNGELDYSKCLAHLRIKTNKGFYKGTVIGRVKLDINDEIFEIVAPKYPSLPAQIIEEASPVNVEKYYSLVFMRTEQAHSLGSSPHPQFFYDFVGVQEK